jgi:hypothetical protein
MMANQENSFPVRVQDQSSTRNVAGTKLVTRKGRRRVLEQRKNQFLALLFFRARNEAADQAESCGGRASLKLKLDGGKNFRRPLIEGPADS